MTVYFLFGKTGSGKSYIGEQLERMGIHHIDGDKHITQRMRDCLLEGEQMTRDMIDAFVEVLVNVIKAQKLKAPQQSFVISQAMYMDHHRHRLLSAIPELKFVMIDVIQAIREDRVSSRFDNNQSKVSLSYAKDMDKFFEAPTHEVLLLQNNLNSTTALVADIKQVMPNLFDIDIQESQDVESSLSYS